jgi:SpoIIAA-like
VIEPIQGAPAGVLAFRVVGEVSAADYARVLAPAVAAAVAAHGGVRFVCELGPEFAGVSAGAAWEDLKSGAGPLARWERCAVVTDRALLAAAVRAVGVLLPGAVRVFPPGERTRALAWAAA